MASLDAGGTEQGAGGTAHGAAGWSQAAGGGARRGGVGARIAALRLRDPLGRLAEARGRLFALVPVLLGLGIWAYFALPREPAPAEAGAALALALAAGALWLRGPERWQPLACALFLAAGGFALAAHRAQSVAAPVLGFRYYGPVEGRVIEIDRSASDRLRLTLDRVVLARIDPARTPERVRVSLLGDPPEVLPEPGLRVMLTGHLGPPGRPVEPGGFDFRRLAWFEGLGAIGYTRNPVMVSEAPAGGSELFLHRLRMTLSAAVRAAIPGDAGGFAAAVTTGDRSGISAAANEAMRASNLSHIISISGMHMSLLAGFVFLFIRNGLALVPWIALRADTKKIAALVALMASAFYLALAGRDVATERAFIMVAMMLVAVLFDRRAISLRSVAMGGLVVLLLRPESLLAAGFQMSFAATVALVAVFGWIRGWTRPWPGWFDILPMTVLASFAAGTATLPFAAAIFNRIPEYGLIANLMAGPAMGVLVMPGAAIALLLAPFGLAAPALWAVGLGSRWILHVADVIAGLEGSVSAVVTPPGAVIPLMVASGIWVVLIGGRARWPGLLPAFLGLALWMGAERPALLVSETGALSGLMTPSGRALSRPTGDAFAAGAWLQADGDMAVPAEAGRRPGMERAGGVARYPFAGREVVHVTGRGAAAAAARECRAGRIVISSVEVALGASGASPGDCLLFEPGSLRLSGAVALSAQEEGGIGIDTVEDRAGARLWTRPFPPGGG